MTDLGLSHIDEIPLHVSWGTSSYPPKGAGELQLDTYLPSVPQSGLVVDVGAGVALSLAAAIHVARPDVTILAVDPGFRELPAEEFDDILDDTIECFDATKQSMLRASTVWRDRLLVGSAEALPIDSSSVDLMVSYAAVPEYAMNLEQVLSECARVLKVGATALHGPMRDGTFANWGRVLEAAKEAGTITDFSSRSGPVRTPRGYTLNSHFTVINK